jgi:flagellar protein FlgJ
MDTQLNSANIYLDSNSLSNLKRLAKGQSDEAIKQVAQQFEALFLQQVLKGILDSDQSKLYTDLYDKQLALNMSAGEGIGLADTLYQQLKLSQAGSIPKMGKS